MESEYTAAHKAAAATAKAAAAAAAKAAAAAAANASCKKRGHGGATADDEKQSYIERYMEAGQRCADNLEPKKELARRLKRD